jgi:hypothetical protein
MVLSILERSFINRFCELKKYAVAWVGLWGRGVRCTLASSCRRYFITLNRCCTKSKQRIGKVTIGSQHGTQLPARALYPIKISYYTLSIVVCNVSGLACKKLIRIDERRAATTAPVGDGKTRRFAIRSLCVINLYLKILLKVPYCTRKRCMVGTLQPRLDTRYIALGRLIAAQVAWQWGTDEL